MILACAIFFFIMATMTDIKVAAPQADLGINSFCLTVGRISISQKYLNFFVIVRNDEREISVLRKRRQIKYYN